MIRNLIFDFGRVLVHFEPDDILSPYIPDPADRAAVVPVAFDRRYWSRLDDGTLTEEELISLAAPTLPERLREPMAAALLNWYRHLPPVNGMDEMIGRLKAEFGVPTYLLSNISRKFTEHTDLFPVLRKMDGCVFSAQAGIVKPSREIFAYTCEKFGLKPEECVFVDDSSRNIAGAEAFGIRGYCFDGDVGRLEVRLRDLLKSRNT